MPVPKQFLKQIYTPMLTLADHFEVIRDTISPILISSRNYNEIVGFSHRFPYDLTRDLGFECRLGEEENGSDYLFCVYRDSPGARILAGNQNANLPDFNSWLQNWETLRGFAKDWITHGSFFHEHVNCIWIKFDYKNDTLCETPEIFLGLDNFPKHDAALRLDFVSSMLYKISTCFFQGNLSQKIKDNILRCISLLPEGGTLYHIGFYPGNTFSEVRLVLPILNREAFPGYLETVQWPGETNKIKEIMPDINKRFDYYVIELDMGEELLPVLGIELYYYLTNKPLCNSRWEKNLRWFEENKWCLPGTADGLLNFPGRHTVTQLYKLYYLNHLNHVKMIFNKSEKACLNAHFGTYIRESTTRKAIGKVSIYEKKPWLKPHTGTSH